MPTTQVPLTPTRVGKLMAATHVIERELQAPPKLGLESRSEFRHAAITVLEQLPEGDSRLAIDLSPTRQVDSAGLGALMLIQRRAAERRQGIVLRHASDEIRFLLALTKLSDLFEFEG